MTFDRKAYAKEYMKEYAKRPEAIAYKKEYLKEYSKKYNAKYKKEHPEKVRECDNVKYAKLRNAVFEKLGRSCYSCGETELEFLTIDHVNNDGFLEKNVATSQKYRAVLKSEDVSRYRTACRNCNSSRAVELRVNMIQKPENGTCKKCGGLVKTRISKHKVYGTRKRSECGTCKRELIRKLRLQVFLVLGSTCSCCGEKKPLKLTIDHVNNDGNVVRKKENYGSAHFYRTILNQTSIDRFQILCWNCNFSKHLGDGVCVHRRKAG